jgi:hypothetical protein
MTRDRRGQSVLCLLCSSESASQPHPAALISGYVGILPAKTWRVRIGIVSKTDNNNNINNNDQARQNRHRLLNAS